MKLTIPSVVLPIWAIIALPVAAQEAEDVASAQETASVAPQQEDKLPQMLDDMAKTQDDDFCAAASYILEQSGDELAFHSRMKEMADQEHPVAMFWLARSLRSGETPYQEEEVASLFRKLVMKAAEKDYLPAMVQAAQSLYYGSETDEERAQGMEMLVRACKMGSAKARACYLVMSGILADKESNLETPEIAAELKHRNYYVEEIVAEAHWGNWEWLREASAHGSAWAAYELSLRGDLKNRESVAYLRLAAERHMPEAMTTLGCLLCLGPLPDGYNIHNSSALPKKALPAMGGQDAEQQPQPEQDTDENTHTVQPGEESIREGLQLLRRATSMGDERAAAFVALAYAAGMGGEISPERIAALLRFAHERELPYGSAGWGYCLVSGKGCEQNVQQGLELLKQVASQGVVWADLALYHLYHEGIGVEKNDAKAAEYRKKFESQQDFSPFIPMDADASFFPALR